MQTTDLWLRWAWCVCRLRVEYYGAPLGMEGSCKYSEQAVTGIRHGCSLAMQLGRGLMSLHSMKLPRYETPDVDLGAVGMRMWTGFIWLRIISVSGSCEHAIICSIKAKMLTSSETVSF
jgi:hypothetical protein